MVLRQTPSKPLELLRFSDLVKLRIVSNRQTLRRWVSAGIFPRPIQLGPNAVAWKATEVEDFLESRKRLFWDGDEPEARPA